MSEGKKYGLILADKGRLQKPTFQATRNVFGDDSDSEEEKRKLPVLRPSHNINRQARITQEKAVIEDPTVYQYDEIYDSMVSKKEEKKIKTKEEKKPRYIENLMKSANKRKIENERRVERQIQKEREKEGDEFADKEVFVTSAYKKKLEEMSLEEEREKREEYLESIGDVTKQRDLGGFYRHLYEQKLGSDDTEKQDKEKSPVKQDTVIENKQSDKLEPAKKRNYRKRKSSSDIRKQLSEGEIEDSDEEIKRLNLKDISLAKKSKQNEANIDADSDFSIDESSEDEADDKKKSVDVKQSTGEESNNKLATPEIAKDSKTKSKSEKDNDELKDEKLVEAVEPKPKIDIWKKRTVGEAFAQALKRYYERKASRGI